MEKTTKLNNNIDVWYFDKKKMLSISYDWKSVLSQEELERSQRFYFEEDRESFVIYHACSRLILSEYLGVYAKQIVIDTKPKGKPFLSSKEVYFNLSHSKDQAVFAVTKNTDIGIDIEFIKKTHDFLQIAERFFHQEEYKKLLSIDDPEEQRYNFYRLWTKKEALLKATGDGIAAGLDKLCHELCEKITILELKSPRNYIASLAILGEEKKICYQDIKTLLKLGAVQK